MRRLRNVVDVLAVLLLLHVVEEFEQVECEEALDDMEVSGGRVEVWGAVLLKLTGADGCGFDEANNNGEESVKSSSSTGMCDSRSSAGTGIGVKSIGGSTLRS